MMENLSMSNNGYYTFVPFTDEQLDAAGLNLVDAGCYDFTVDKATRKVSKSGNPMCELQLTVWDIEGKPHVIFDYLVFSAIPLNIRKVKHFCMTVGLLDEYNKGALPEDLTGRSGKVEIGIKDPQPKEGGGTYPKKNVVLDYLADQKPLKRADMSHEQAAMISASRQTSASVPFNDDLPF